MLLQFHCFLFSFRFLSLLDYARDWEIFPVEKFNIQMTLRNFM